jgi:aminoglycoside phosphotransferase family enzyme/predicted kinase
MELDRLIEGLSRPAAYPEAVDSVEVRHTHISAVFLAGAHAYKIKKPVDLGFLDFTTLEKRRYFCAEEVRLNRRLAPGVYLDVVPIVAAGQAVRVEGPGQAVEWAVKMRRLPDDATLEYRLAHDQLDRPTIRALARKIALFHAAAARGEHISHFGRYEVVERNALENLQQSAGQIGTAIHRAVFDRLQFLTLQSLAQARALIERRAGRGVPCDTHGDLRLGHVYSFPDRPPPDDLVVVDCIEFNERFRYADPVSDMAFLAMSLARAGRDDLGAAFVDAYFHATLDDEGRALLPFYVSYRAAVRGKVDGLQATRAEIPEADRALALSKARGYWLAALAALEEPDRRPCLVLIGGLPGTGKSTLAAELARRAGFEVIRSDLVRKELAKAASAAAEARQFESGIYSPQWTERTYAECLKRVEQLLFQGRRVIVDASFRADAHRRSLLEAAAHWGVPGVLLICRADPRIVRKRLDDRVGDASDADWSIYEQAARRWEQPQSLALRHLASIDTSHSLEQSLDQALGVLRDRRLCA